MQGAFRLTALVAAAFAVATLGACASTRADQTANLLEAEAQSAFDTGSFAGLAVGVYRGDEVLLERGWGWADVERGIPITAQTVFHVGSITKPITGLAINQLAADGVLSMSDTVGRWLPDYAGPARAVTIEQLLTHTSGIPDYVPAVAADFGAFDRQRVVGLFAERPLAFEPGSKWSYSNSGTYLLGLIIETASGQSYADYIADHVARPLGLTSTAFPDESDHNAAFARGYFFTGQGFSLSQNYDPTLPFSAGALLSSLGDIAAFSRAAYGREGERRVPIRVQQALVAPFQLSHGEDAFYRRGSVAVLSFEGRRMIAHAGLTSGFTSHFAYFPEQDLSVVVLTNTTGSVRHPANIAAALARIALGVVAPEASPQNLSGEEARAYSGDYAMDPFRFFGTDVFGISARDTGVVLQFGPADPSTPAIPLIYRGDDTFVSAADHEHVFRFRRGAGGQVAGFDLFFYGMPFSGNRR